MTWFRASPLISGLLTGLAAAVAQAQFFAPAQFMPQPSSAASSQLLVSQVSSPINTADRYMALGYTATLSATEFRSMVFPVAGVATSLRARVGNAPIGGDTWTVTLMLNGAPSALTCQITDSSSQICVGTNSGSGVAVAAGDYASIKVAPAGSPNTGPFAVSVIFTPTVANDTIILAEAVALSNSATNAVQPFTNAAVGTVSNRRTNILPDGGTIDNLYAVSNAPGAGTSYTYTLDKNGSTTSVTCAIANSATACNDGSNSSTVAANDDIQFQAIPAGTPAAATTGFGVRYRPTTTGSFAFMTNGQGTANSTTVATYYALAGGTGSTTETNAQNVVDSSTFTKVAVRLPSAPTSGKSRVYTLRKNGADTALTCTIADAATTCSATGSISIANGDLLTVSDVPSGTPSAVSPQISLLANR